MEAFNFKISLKLLGSKPVDLISHIYFDGETKKAENKGGQDESFCMLSKI